MAFPPHFLDELRGRAPLAGIVGRRVRLTRKGREHSGLCPFHNEKTPSFTVSEDKGFFHCFGCGAHGDAIGFVMRSENLSFPEAVERLAAEAGIAVPVTSPAERETAAHEAGLLEIVERACAFFESRLHGPARDYLRGRGLDDDTIARFRLGFAPDSRTALKAALLGSGGHRAATPTLDARPDGRRDAPAGAIDEARLIEAGLLIRPDEGGSAYDRFRNRVIFPIADRRGRVIAFGGRALGDPGSAAGAGAGPKYLNSPDTPLFHKGRVLYGLSHALPASRATGRVVVAEGYMDAIALSRAGIAEAVAPLGTALTESQIELLWRMAPEPVLCFDGDQAGQRAAYRAAERALPLLRPGFSLRFVALPAGEDPDTLIARDGRAGMERLLEAAQPLDSFLFNKTLEGKRIAKPEERASIEHQFEQLALRIADRRVQFHYKQTFHEKFHQLIRAERERKKNTKVYDAGLNNLMQTFPEQKAHSALNRRIEQAALATVLNHWGLLDEFAEILGTLHFSDPALDRLRGALLSLFAASPDLDSVAVARHLKETGCADGLDAVLTPGVYKAARSARADADAALARAGLGELIQGMRVEEARRQYAARPDEETLARLRECERGRYESLRHSL